MLTSFRDGVKRVVSAPAVLMGVFVVTGVMAVLPALSLRRSIDAHLGSSLAAHEAADAANLDWWQEFQAQASGLASTFTPSVIGFAAVLHNVSGIADGKGGIAPVAGILAGYLTIWTFMSGAIVDRLARQRATRAHGFFAAGGVFFFRFLRLGAIAGAAYWVLFDPVHGWLFGDLFGRVSRDLSVERTAIAWRAGLYAGFGLLVAGVNVLVDYARIRAVVEDRRSMLFALLAAARFVSRNPSQVFGLYALNALAFVTVIAVWALVAPGAGRSGAALWLGFVVAQAYILARLFLKLHFIASQTALFQSRLAHAAYTAAPPQTWPESPSAEAVRTGG